MISRGCGIKVNQSDFWTGQSASNGKALWTNMKRVVFLDRDGTLNVDRGYICRVKDWQFTPGAPEAIKRLRDGGYSVVVVSNQSGIGRGLYQRCDVEALHKFVQAELRAYGTRVDAFAYCPHLPSDLCGCRKPATGLARQVEAELAMVVDYLASWTIGDKPSDLEFGKNLGTRTCLVRSQYWSPEQLSAEPEMVCDSLASAALEIIQAACLPGRPSSG
jgi:D-glycero-D-manno-heptose 1,7-bisphosphate phosphatase